ncbi:MAG TPA: hypothetical protein VKL19_05100 [Thermoanaerobaculia bacterium]|nr:hypothetical protein [Thermoanaerobaculia bacterium]
MRNDDRRITLVIGNQRNWNSSIEAGTRIVFLDSLTMLRSTIAGALVGSDADVERIVLDRTCSESEFLSLLTELPHEFSGDIMMIRDGQASFLSAMGRGGDRILYALRDDDVEFYLETVGLVRRTEKMDLGVLKFRPRQVKVEASTSAGIQDVDVNDERLQSDRNS